MKSFILDGYNLIYAISTLRRKMDAKAEDARTALLEECVFLSSKRKDIKHIYVVFDGREEHEEGPRQFSSNVSAIFTRAKEEADDRIIHMVQNEQVQAPVVIVSSDSYVFNRSRSLGVDVMRSVEFYEMIRQKKEMQGSANSENEKDISTDEAKDITSEYEGFLGLSDE